MIRHIVVWDLKEELTKKEKQEAKGKIKVGLERLVNQEQGILQIQVHTQPLESSNCDIMLDSLYADKDALDRYQNSEEHKKVGAFIGQVCMNRRCFDYETE